MSAPSYQSLADGLIGAAAMIEFVGRLSRPHRISKEVYGVVYASGCEDDWTDEDRLAFCAECAYTARSAEIVHELGVDAGGRDLSLLLEAHKAHKNLLSGAADHATVGA